MVTNLALYRVLHQLGVDDINAEAASSLDVSELATKQDLQTGLQALKADVQADLLGLKMDMLNMETRLAWKVGGLVVTSMLGMTGLFALIVKWMVAGPTT